MPKRDPKPDVKSLEKHVKGWKLAGKKVEVTTLDVVSAQELVDMFEVGEVFVALKATVAETAESGETSAPQDAPSEQAQPTRIIIAMAPSKPGSE